MQFLSGLFGCGFTTLLLGIGAWAEIPVMTPVWPTITEWGGLFALGAIATTGHMLVVYALKYANASVLALFNTWNSSARPFSVGGFLRTFRTLQH